jgi:hypothetical protein
MTKPIPDKAADRAPWQVSPAQRGGKNAESGRDECSHYDLSVGIARLQGSPTGRGMISAVALKTLIQIKLAGAEG